MQDFAACTVRRWRHGVERYLDTVPESVEAQTMGARLATEDCLISGQMQFQEALYRAAAYEAMYRVTFARQGVSDFASVPPIDYAQPGAPTDKAASARATLRRLADCAVRHGPLEARALILSPIGGPDESAAFAAVTPMVSACMPADATVNFSKISLRGYVGEALYRLSMAARGASALPS
ncbi:hypothetical protein [Sphingobium yanoikuyae]|uniref:Uncharacterized protein n=2 Tax=Sphingomonadaceae TaxID=41297 RepID=A0A9X7UDC1_SPHYA|nr:hypothetical protein [Sphingobium yanoikuyae]QNG44340.1 hypothetical protein H3V42_21030 [Sphingobium yanoikuyae]